jgi:hypothetical protein
MWDGLAHIFRRVGLPLRIDFQGIPFASPGDTVAVALLASHEWHRLPPIMTFCSHTDLRPQHVWPLEAAACAAWLGMLPAPGSLPAGFLTDMTTLPGPPIVSLDTVDGRIAFHGWIELEDTDTGRLEREVADAEVPYVDTASEGTSSGHGSA